jgi:hypothetical protein
MLEKGDRRRFVDNYFSIGIDVNDLRVSDHIVAIVTARTIVINCS